MRNGAMVYIGARRPTLVGGDVAALGYGFNLGGVLKAGAGILGSGARALLGLPSAPKTAVGPNAFAGPAAAAILPVLPAAAKATFPYSPGELLRRTLFPGGPAFGGGRRRRMNPLNLRALTRADRRVTRFADIARKYVSPTSAHRKVRAFKKRRR
jgi:hypothetical protein